MLDLLVQNVILLDLNTGAERTAAVGVDRGFISCVIPAGERDNVDNMYKQYEALGPNNVISDIYNQVRALPSIAPEAHPMEAHAIVQ